jgi:hypothetical protein
MALVGCATVRHPVQDLPPAAAARIKRLAILGIDDPKGLSPPLGLGNGVGVGIGFGVFGPIGVVAAIGFIAQRVSSRSAEFSRAIAPQQASFASLLADELVTSLADRDVQVDYLGGLGPKPLDRDRFDYSGIPKDADAWLHVRLLSIGFAEDPSGAVSAPSVDVSALVLDPSSGSKLFQRSVRVNCYPPQAKTVGLEVIPCPAQPRFVHFEALLAAPEPAADAMREAVRSAAKHIVLKLGLPPKDTATRPPGSAPSTDIPKSRGAIGGAPIGDAVGSQ